MKNHAPTAWFRFNESPRDSSSSKWNVTVTETNQAGSVIMHSGSYEEVASGLNYPDEQGVWQRADPAFEAVADGYAALRTLHKVRLAANLNQADAVQFTTEAGGQLRSAPLALGYYDPVSGKSVTLAQLQDTAPMLWEPEVVVYPDAFDRVWASVRYSNRRDGLHQDVILHELPPSPESFGLSAKSRLEVYTEYDAATPEPAKETSLLREEKDAARRREMAEPDFSDETLHFDATAFMGPGRAFTLEGGPEVASTIRVGKRFERIGGRAVLIEAVEWAELPPLPGTEGGAALQRSSSATEVATGRRLPSRIVPGGPRQTAGLRRAFAPRGLVIDYELKNGSVSTFTFATGTTYHITAAFSVGTGSLTIQPGAILKFARLSQVDFSGLLVCPAVRRRYVHVHFNGVAQATRLNPFLPQNSAYPPTQPIYEETQRPDWAFLKSWYPASDTPSVPGALHLMEVWAEELTTPTSVPLNNIWARLRRYASAAGIHKRASYRWNWLARTAGSSQSAHDFTRVFSLIDAADATIGSVSLFKSFADSENWMRAMALVRAMGHTDSVGWKYQHNLYALFRGDLQRWQLVPWDLDAVFKSDALATDPAWPLTVLKVDNGNPESSPELGKLITLPEFRRAYLRGLKQAADGPLLQLSQAANTEMDFYTQGLKANGVTLSPEAALRLSENRTWTGARRTTLLNTYTAQDSTAAPAFAVTTVAHSTTALTDTLTGRAPLVVATLEILRNGIVLATTPVWSADAADDSGRPILWSVAVPLLPGTVNTFTVRGKSITGGVIATGTVAITQTP